MNIDFLLLITALTFISGLICLVDKCCWQKSRAKVDKLPLIIEYARSFFSVFLAVLIIRSFIGQVFHVPTGSLKPTVMPGDFMLVTQYNYGLTLPVANIKIVPIGEPKRGDIVVFRWPVNKKVNFVKRVIGLPGDTISYINNTFVINGTVIPQKFIGYAMDDNGGNTRSWPVKVMEEDLLGIKHKIYVCADHNNCPSKAVDFYNITVPQGAYFMVGDNRDNSQDSRVWGHVFAKDLIGKAQIVVFNWSHLIPSLERSGAVL